MLIKAVKPMPEGDCVSPVVGPGTESFRRREFLRRLGVLTLASATSVMAPRTAYNLGLDAAKLSGSLHVQVFDPEASRTVFARCYLTDSEVAVYSPLH